MTATHECPHCSEEIVYHPNKYHTTVTCAECEGEFGFRLYTTGPIIDERVRQELRERASKRQQKHATAAWRLARGPLPLPPAQKRRQEEMLYRMCLLDKCPRCGVQAKDENEDTRWRHLGGCHDPAVHAAHARAEVTPRSRFWNPTSPDEPRRAPMRH